MISDQRKGYALKLRGSMDRFHFSFGRQSTTSSKSGKQFNVFPDPSNSQTIETGFLIDLTRRLFSRIGMWALKFRTQEVQ